MESYIIVSLIACGISLLGSFLVLRLFPKLNLMDNPVRYGFKRKPVPYSAGIILYVLFLLIAVLFLEFDLKLIGVLVGATLLVVTSFLDDRYNLSPYLRLLIQIIVASLVVLTGSHIFGFNLPLVGWIEFGELGGQIITAVWLLMLMNVMNWLDGVPGLATGASGITFLTIFVLSVVPQIHTLPQEGAATISLSLGIGSLVMLFFSYPKLKYLIGDTGSMFLGLMLGVVSVYSGGKVATAALVLFIPIFDAVWTILRRLYRKKSPFKGDMKHLHHRLQNAGLSKQKLIGYYLLFMVVIALISLGILSTSAKGLLALILLLFLGLVAGLIVYLETKYDGSS